MSIIQYRNDGIEPSLWLTEEEVMLLGPVFALNKLFCVISTESSVTRNVRVVKGTSQLLIYFARARPGQRAGRHVIFALPSHAHTRTYAHAYCARESCLALERSVSVSNGSCDVIMRNDKMALYYTEIAAKNLVF